MTLGRESTPDDYKRSLTKIDRAAATMADLVQDLLLLARSDSPLRAARGRSAAGASSGKRRSYVEHSGGVRLTNRLEVIGRRRRLPVASGVLVNRNEVLDVLDELRQVIPAAIIAQRKADLRT